MKDFELMDELESRLSVMLVGGLRQYGLDELNDGSLWVHLSLTLRKQLWYEFDSRLQMQLKHSL